MIRLIIEVPDEEAELLLALLPKFNARLIARLPSEAEELVNKSRLNLRPKYPIHDCEMMHHHLETWFSTPEDIDNVDAIIAYYPSVDEYGIRIYDGGSSYILISYCPWCGAKLPESKKDEWSERLERMGIDTTDEAQIPEAFKSDAWYHE